MSEYDQPKINNPHRLPDSLNRYCMNLVRDYPRLIKRLAEEVPGTPEYTEKLIRCEAVEQALRIVKPEYRKGILNYLTRKVKQYPAGACNETYMRECRKFKHQIAVNLKIL